MNFFLLFPSGELCFGLARPTIYKIITLSCIVMQTTCVDIELSVTEITLWVHI